MRLLGTLRYILGTIILIPRKLQYSASLWTHRCCINQLLMYCGTKRLTPWLPKRIWWCNMEFHCSKHSDFVLQTVITCSRLSGYNCYGEHTVIFSVKDGYFGRVTGIKIRKWVMEDVNDQSESWGGSKKLMLWSLWYHWIVWIWTSLPQLNISSGLSTSSFKMPNCSWCLHTCSRYWIHCIGLQGWAQPSQPILCKNTSTRTP
jgi:hypothetical protein